MRITHRGIALAALLAWVSALTGCATTRNVFQKGETTVKLASKRGEKLGLNHPIIIAPVRLSHILSRIDVRRSVTLRFRLAPRRPV